MMFAINEETKATVGAQFHCANASASPATNPSRSLAALPQGFGKAGLLLAACLLYLAPAPAALAQNECGDPDANGATDDSFTCPTGDFSGTGFTHDSNGNLELIVPFVTEDDDFPELEVGEHGIVTTGNGGDNLILDASRGTPLEFAGEGVDITGSGADAVIDFTTNTGDIDIRVDRIEGGSSGHGVRARSTGGGNVSILTREFLFGFSETAIEATTVGGDIQITNENRIFGGGIVAETSGTGSITIAGEARVGGSTGIRAIAEDGPIDMTFVGGVTGSDTGIHASAATGDITISVPFVGGGILTETDGLATINIIDLVTSGQGQNSGGTIAVGGSIIGVGGNVVVNVSGAGVDREIPLGEADAKVSTSDGATRIDGPFDFTGLSGGAEVNFGTNSLWQVTDPNSPDDDAAAPRSVFSPGDDVVNIGARAMLITPDDAASLADSLPPVDDRYVVDFGDGEDVFNNGGVIAVGTRATGINNRGNSAELRFENLEVFNNAGEIWLGSRIFQSRWRGDVLGGFGRTDRWPNDILTLPDGTHWHGVVDGDGRALGRIVADVNLGLVGQQEGCGAEFRFADGSTSPTNGNPNFRLPVADCIDLRGGSASGRTGFVIEQMVPGDRGAYNPEGSALVDLAGGDLDATAPDAFVVAPESEGYTDRIGNGAVDKGLFFYTIALDRESEQFRIYGLPSTGTQQFPLLGQAANGLWRTATGAWFDRRVDQRDVDTDAGLGSGAWGRVSRQSGDRDLFTPIVAGGDTLVFDNSYSQDDVTVTLGGDLIARSAGNVAWVVGGMLGYARSEVEYDDSRNSANMEGMHAGLYASLTWNDFYLDLAANHASLEVNNDVPAMELFPAGTVLDTELDSLGGQIEAGWRLSLGRFSVEPIAGFTFVKSEIDDIVVPADDPERLGGDVTLSDVNSQRGSLGLRLRMDDVAPGIVPISVGLTARGIEEFDGESKVVVDNIGPQNALAEDTFDGTFVNVAGDVSITNAAKTVAGFIKVDGTFHDDYESFGVSTGFRYQW